MAYAIKDLGDGQVGTSEATLYTTPIHKQAIVKTITLVNTDTSTRTVNLYVRRDGANSRRFIPKDLSIAAGASFEWEGTITLEAADLITGKASVASVVDYTISGVEEDSVTNAGSGFMAILTFVIDGGMSTITTGQKGHLRIPFDCTINRVTMMADQSGSIVVDIWKDTYANFPPTNADSITASAPPTITTAQKSEDSTLTGWTTAITADDILAFNVDSITTVTRVTISLKVTKI